MNKKAWKQIFTIPNILSCFRIVLIPIFVLFYSVYHNNTYAVLILVLSGVTDIIDGFIARHFSMISDIGKALDPIADKLTQLVVLICLGLKFPMMFILAAALAVKELASGILALIVVKKTKTVKGSDWHGKVSTFLLYAMMALHIIWRDIPLFLSHTLFLICLSMIALSFILYLIKHITALTEYKSIKQAENK